MREEKKLRGRVLLIVGVALVAITVLVLLSLHNPLQHQSDSEQNTGASKTGGSSSPPTYPRSGSTVERRAEPAPETPPPASQTFEPAPTPPRRAQAPAAIPVEIQNETDPAKKVELLKMHRLTTARVRVSMLRRRRDLLQSSLSEARRLGSWSSTKIQDAEKQLAEVSSAVSKAEENLEQVRQEVGGDIDKGRTQ